MSILSECQPKKVFEYFEKICSIPHGSGNTKQISDYCVSFAKEHNLKYTQDKMGNVIIHKGGSKGYENHPAVILQGHLDMVCERNDAISSIDMENEGLKLDIDGDYLHACGTTLGGDDGIAIAYALAVLDSDELKHPPVVALFTVDEEIGLLGAVGVDLAEIEARTMINIDSEEEGIFLTSCAGGATSVIEIPFETSEEKSKCLCITLDGLKGGHSGAEIDKKRGNSNKLLARFLHALSKKTQFTLCEINGGLKNNAIPLMSKACICTDNTQAVKDMAVKYNKIFKSEYKTADNGVNISISEECNCNNKCMTKKDTKKIIDMLYIIPDGVQTMSADINGLVESSLNLGILKTTDSSVYAEFCVRSSVETRLDEMNEKLAIITELSSGKFTIKDQYPGWEYKKDSKLREIMIEAYKELFGNQPVVTAIHAGLECGLFSGKLEGLDCISIGPQMHDIHTYKERLSISSTERVWKLIIATLEKL